MSTVAIVTAWKDHPELEADYFEAVEQEQPDQLVIVDDGSQPPLPFAAARLEESAGFCIANNHGLRLVECEITVFLNNDVQVARPGWLAELVGLVEPGVLVAPLRFDPVYCEVDGVVYPYADGWCLAGYTSELRDLGGWDESFDQAGPAYFSDTALSFKARIPRSHGGPEMRLREARPGLRHKGGQTGGVDRARFERALSANRAIYEQQVRATIGGKS